jgi:hypothetical protein
MMLRRCQPCGAILPIAAFAWRRVDRGLRDTYCYRCRAEYKQRHYAANRERYIRNARDRQLRELERRTRLLWAYLETHPCADCGEADPTVLEFDHVGEKRFGISSGLRRRNWEDVLAEIERCEVVCANCHRRRTYRRQGSWRHRLADPGPDAVSERRLSYTVPSRYPSRPAGVAQW